MNTLPSTPTFPWDRFRASWKAAEKVRAFSDPEAAEYFLAGLALDEDPALRQKFEDWYRTSPEFRAGVERGIQAYLPAADRPETLSARGRRASFPSLSTAFEADYATSWTNRMWWRKREPGLRANGGKPPKA